MRIVCERSGGFAGLITRAEVDSDALPAAQKRELQTLIEQSQLLDQLGKKRKAKAVADGFQYDLTVTTEDAEHTLTLNDGAVSEDMLALLDWLMAHKKVKR
jgi:hypothetical protein